jgi:hypothetical protein
MKIVCSLPATPDFNIGRLKVCEDKEYEYFKKWWKSKQEFWHSNMFSDRDIAYSAFLKGRKYTSQSIHAPDTDMVRCAVCGDGMEAICKKCQNVLIGGCR